MRDARLEIETFEEMRDRIVGQAFPGGTFRVEEHERWLSHEAMKSPVIEPPYLHPVWILLGGLRGMGLTIEELVGLAGVGPKDGTLFGETTVEQRAPLRSGVDYRVTGSVVSLERRHGKRAGTFDVMTFELHVSDLRSGEVVAVNSQSFILKRRSDVAD